MKDRFKIPLSLILAMLGDKATKAVPGEQKTSDALPAPLDTRLASTPFEVVYQEDRVRLKHYLPQGATQVKTPLLIVFPLVHRDTLLDLQPDRSLIRHLLDAGIELYLIDWGYPTRKDRYLTIDDHVNGYVDNITEFIRRRHTAPRVNLLGICMAGTFALMYAALHPKKVQNLITMVSPVYFHTDKGLMHLWLKELDVDRLVDTYGNIPGDLVNLSFLMLNPARLLIDKYIGFLENLDNTDFIENFLRMEKWIFDSPDVPGETFRQYIRDCYQQNLFIQSRMELDGQRVELNRINMPLLNIYGRYDHLVPPEACEPLGRGVGSRDVTDICLDTGHVGAFVNSKWQKELVPQIQRWLQERDGQEADKSRPARGKKNSKGNRNA